MKKLISLVLALALCAALALPALAEEGIPLDGVVNMYVSVEKAKIYEAQDLESKVLKEVKGGDKLLLEMKSQDEKWYATLVEDSKNGGQTLGWILAENLSETIPQSFCTHDWDDWMVEMEPTCDHTGYRYRFCKVCGLREEDTTEKLPHDFDKWTVNREATCTEKGERVRVCKVCGFEEKEEYLAEHDFDAWKMIKEPTCTEKGERTHTCKVCKTEVKQELDMLPHDYKYQVTTEATDHSSGVRAKICKVCGHNGGEESFDPEGTMRRKDRGENVYYMQQLLVDQGYLNVGGADGIFGGGTEKALMQFQKDHGLNVDGIAWPQTLKLLNHDFGPWETVKEMTRTEPGERVRVCKDCGFEQHEIIESGTVFEKGRRGEDIRALQQIIKEVGYDAGSFDGIYGGKLDAAMAAFAAEKGLTVEEGRIRPADVDAVMNAWIQTIPEETWMGESGVDNPVNLALSVTPKEGSADAEGVTTYSWSLTNLGSEKAMFHALLLTFGDEPDFKADVMVMALDGIELKANAGNSASGSFTASSGWGEGTLNFAAMAVSESDGAKWLSNTVSFENLNASAAKVVLPMVEAVDVNNLPDGIYPVAFDRGDVLMGASGIYMNAVRVYAEEIYDIVDINTLAVGDTIVVEGEAIPVESIDRGSFVTINGGLEEGGVELVSREDTNGYFVFGLDDMCTYSELGVTTLTVDPSATFTDSWDIENDPVTVNFDGIIEAMQTSENEYFVQYNTTVRVEAGKVVEINRVYVP